MGRFTAGPGVLMFLARLGKNEIRGNNMTFKGNRSALGTAAAVVALAAFMGLATAPGAPARAQL